MFLIGCTCGTCHEERVFRDRSSGFFSPNDGTYYHLGLTSGGLDDRLACQRERPDTPDTPEVHDGSESSGYSSQVSLFKPAV